jgi:Uma2 family endonuclease
MSNATLISVSEYLATSYRPDRDYIDGEVQERNLGERDHSWMQDEIFLQFHAYRASLGLYAFLEQRIQVKPTRFRVPDISVTRGYPAEQVFTQLPFLCIEILSPEDSESSMQERIDDYLAFGVENIWLIDPERRRASWVDSTGIHFAKNSILETKDGSVRVDFITMWPRI